MRVGHTDTIDLQARSPVSETNAQIDRQIGRQAINSSASPLHMQTGKQTGSLFSTMQTGRHCTTHKFGQASQRTDELGIKLVKDYLKKKK